MSTLTCTGVLWIPVLHWAESASASRGMLWDRFRKRYVLGFLERNKFFWSLISLPINSVRSPEKTLKVLYIKTVLGFLATQSVTNFRGISISSICS